MGHGSASNGLAQLRLHVDGGASIEHLNRSFEGADMTDEIAATMEKSHEHAIGDLLRRSCNPAEFCDVTRVAATDLRSRRCS
jgi:hypothetical protein